MHRRIVVGLAVVGLVASCVVPDPPGAYITSPPKGVYVEAACMCAICWDRSFCYDPVSGDHVELGENDPCPSGTYQHGRRVELFDTTRDLRSPERTLQQAGAGGLTFCVPPSGPGSDVAPTGNGLCPDVTSTGHVDRCIDVPRQCRDPSSPRYVSCPEQADPNGPACLPDPLDQYGPVRGACGATGATVPLPWPSQQFTDQVNAGLKAGEAKLLDKCAAYGSTPPTFGQGPRRYCYANCFVLHPCLQDASENCNPSCNPVTTDPPYVPPEAFHAVADNTKSGIILNVVVLGPNNSSQNFIGSTNVGGEVAFDLSRDCLGPLPNNQNATCARAELTRLLLDSFGSFTIGGKTVEHLRMLLEKPTLLQGITLGDTTLLTVPPGTTFGVSTDLDTVGRLGNDFTNTAPMVVIVDWTKKEFAVLATISDPQNLSSLTLAAGGPIGNQPPRANAGPDQTLECTSPSTTLVALTGQASMDPDGLADLASYTWTWTDGHSRISNGMNLTVSVPDGVHRFGLTVRDKGGASDVDDVDVTIRDTTPPTLTLAPQPECLWAPDHKVIVYELAKELVFTATDTCDASPSVEIVAVTSNQPNLGPPDFLFGKKGLCLRAERLGNGADRVYTITIRATDKTGNKVTRNVVVRVPHDQAGAAKCPKVDPSRLVDVNDPRCTQN